ncbi:hypothetical protein JHL22_10290 [Advenella sp. WQ 585]|uniref:Conjugal transfer protein TrbC n=1 Tax=Advenella mandrilli TaxID=2800330 RepID=A0ABS1EEI6_9BURK|nr:TrbC/VirB2 family protein [Advenella mandrilli]MBK1781608.1 hypothetical protein [Advenella mandrilli]
MSIVVNKENPKSLDLKAVFKESLLFLLLAVFLFVCSDAMAQVGGGGGFANEAKRMIENVRDGIVIIVGVVAMIALVWTMAQGFQGKKTWSDVLEMSLWIFGAGAAVLAATWFFTSGQKVTFG